MSQKAKIVTAICFILCIALIILTIFVIKPGIEFKNNRNKISVLPVSEIDAETDKIHFLSTGSSDAILIESDGKFALVDCAEDTDNPRGFEDLDLPGYEQKVLDYLKANAMASDGKVHLDFVLGTHSHSDHIGGFDTIISDSDIEIGRAYLKVYDSSKIRDKEVKKWDNQEVYDQMVDALNSKKIPIVSKPDNKPFTLGNLTITLYNTDDPETEEKLGENDQSIGVLVEKNGTKVFLAGDMDNITGDEERVAKEIGKIDLLKVAHHSYSLGNTSSVWLKSIEPKVCVVTNDYKGIDLRTIFRITRINDAPILVTGKENGIVAEIGDNGEISFYNEIH